MRSEPLALSPQRFGRVAQRWQYPLCIADGVRHNAPQPLGLIPSLCCGALALKAISLGYFSLGQQRKVTRAPAGDRNARCVSGTLAKTRQPGTEALDSCLRRNDEQEQQAA